MPQFSPVSWLSVFVFLIGMMTNMCIINWWYGSEVYGVDRIKENSGSAHPRLFIWGKKFIKI